MRLYGVIQAFRQNKYPDNVQIDETLKFVVKHSPVDESQLSRDGKKLIQDVRDIIETVSIVNQYILCVFRGHPLPISFDFRSY